MSPRSNPESPSREPLRIAVPRSRAEEVIDRHIGEARSLQADSDQVATDEHYDSWDKRRQRWIKLTAEGLRSIYTNPDPVEEFIGAADPPNYIGGGSVAESFEWQRKEVDSGNNCLVSLRERLEYVEALGDASAVTAGPAEEVPEQGQQIFIVHGHANDVKEAVGRLLEKVGNHKVVILHEQPSEGRTLIEKFEDHAGVSDTAVVLLTADDVGGVMPNDGAGPDLSPRARQNVVFELGFFVGRFGRSRVVVLYGKGVELPSDFKGVVYIPLDDDSWRYKLLQELRSAGLDLDLNELPA
jgi:predicted nucleotide-binding protein